MRLEQPNKRRSPAGAVRVSPLLSTLDLFGQALDQVGNLFRLLSQQQGQQLAVKHIGRVRLQVDGLQLLGRGMRPRINSVSFSEGLVGAIWMICPKRTSRFGSVFSRP